MERTSLLNKGIDPYRAILNGVKYFRTEKGKKKKKRKKEKDLNGNLQTKQHADDQLAIFRREQCQWGHIQDQADEIEDSREDKMD